MSKKSVLSCAFALSLGISGPAWAKAIVPKTARVSGALAHVQNAGAARVSGEFLVTFKGDAERTKALRDLSQMGAIVVKSFRSSPTVLIRMSVQENAADFATMVNALENHPAVRSMEANTVVHLLTAPNDDRFGELYALNNAGQTGGTAGADIGAVTAWDITTGSKGVLVGIIDTGIDYTHPDLAANIWTNPGETGVDSQGRDKSTNGVDDDGNGYVDDFHGWDFVNNDNNPMDDQGHGTHTAGTIGAVGNNRTGVSGVNWNVSLVSMKFLGADGSGTLDAAVEAIEYATKLGVKLTSNSWGGGGYSAAMEAAIKEARDKGILFIAAAGNEANDNDAAPTYPATYQLENVISVAATDDKDELAYFSNYGKKSVHLGAPGVDILSTAPGGKYVQLSGTSMACPHVAGAAALIMGFFPGIDFKAVKTRLLNNATGISALADKAASAGRLSLPNSLETDTKAPGLPGAASVLSSGLFDAKLDWQVAGDDGTEGRASSYEVRYIASATDTPLPTSWENSVLLGTIRDFSQGDRIPFTIDNVADDFRGFVAIRAQDNVGNFGSFSTPTYVRLADRVIVSSVDADSAADVKFSGGAGTEKVEGRGLVFSDSPDGDYKVGIDASVTFPAVTINLDKETYLTYWNSYDLEPRFDFGMIEMRVVGTDKWTLLNKISGSSAWKKEFLKLPKEIAGEQQIEIRFRTTSDRSVNYAGWSYDSVSLVQVP
jgi:subtilisin family serine protease